MLERVNDPVKLEELTGLIDGISTKMDDVYTKAQHAIDAAEEKSRIESRLQDMISDVKSNDLTPMKSEISMIHYTLNDAVRDVNENYDKLVSLGNRIGMK